MVQPSREEVNQVLSVRCELVVERAVPRALHDGPVTSERDIATARRINIEVDLASKQSSGSPSNPNSRNEGNRTFCNGHHSDQTGFG